MFINISWDCFGPELGMGDKLFLSSSLPGLQSLEDEDIIKALVLNYPHCKPPDKHHANFHQCEDGVMFTGVHFEIQQTDLIIK